MIESLEQAANAPSVLPPELEYHSPSTISDDVAEPTTLINLSAAFRVACDIRDDSRVTSNGTAQAAAMERFRVFDDRLHQLRRSQPLKCILVTSAGPGKARR